MNIPDVARSTERDCLNLQWNIDHTPEGMAYMIDNCELTAECTPAITTLIFYKDEGRYVMRLEQAVCYRGNNQAMATLCEGKPLFFPDMTMMRQFFNMLPAVAESQNQTPGEHALERVVNMDEITIPAEAAQTVYDYKDIQRELEKIVMGQDTAIETIAYQTALHLNKKNPKKPLSIMTYGPPGTGKSETAKALAKVLSKLGPNRYSEVWTDLNQFTEAHSIHKLIGSPPGYVGYSDRAILDRVNDNKYTIFHLDEADKCHSDILKLMLSILDEGRCTANQEREGSNLLHFEHCIFIFTSNFKLGTPSSKRKIGFSFSEDVESIRRDNSVEVSYTEHITEEEHFALTMRIFHNTEAARKAFVEAGVLPEISSRFNCFCQFHELSTEAKVKILVKMVIETGFEYDIRLTHISSPILQSLIDAATSENTLTVRSFRALIEGYLAAAFAEAATRYAGQVVRLEGALDAPIIVA